MASQASAATVFYDDFSDGSVINDVPVDRDGNPVRWTEQPNSGDFDATSGDYVLTATTNDRMSSEVVDITLTDISIRTQVRTSADDTGVFVSARVQEPLGFPGSSETYFGGIGDNANTGGTSIFLGRSDGPGDFMFFGVSPVLPFDVRTEDGVLQLDVIGNELKLWGWKAGDPMPDQPQLTATDSKYSEGTMRISNNADNPNISTFRYVHVADMHIPEPSALALTVLGLLGLIANGRRRHTT
jgi:hypothetical protein